MASPSALASEKSMMEVSELVEFTKKELAADAEREAQELVVGNGESLSSQTGVTLDISHKSLRTLPVEVIELIRNRVERLALSHNHAIHIPPQVVQLERLRYLNIRWNGLKQFPENILQLSQLEILDLSKNKITSIPEGIKGMTSLKFLAIAKNRVTRLPLALGEMTSLSKLKFDENPIEFPPPEALKPPQGSNFAVDVDKEREVCQQVKKFLRTEASRLQLRTLPDEEQSESQLETPRPSKRIAPAGHQRFPVKPSLSGLDNFHDGKTNSPDAPTIPPKSHARLQSTSSHFSSRPGIAPMPLAGLAGSEMHRSLSTTSAATLNRRHGFVPHKHPQNLGSIGSITSLGAATDRSSQVTIKGLPHSRGPSSSTFLFPGPGGDSSSEAVSPVDPPSNRRQAFKRLSTLREGSRARSSPQIITTAGRRLLLMFTLLGPLSDVIDPTPSATPRGNAIGRAHIKAKAYVGELDRCFKRLEDSDDDTPRRRQEVIRSIVMYSTAALEAYGKLAAELRNSARDIVQRSDPSVCRVLMMQMHTSMIEARNIIIFFGVQPKIVPTINFIRQPPETPRLVRPPTSRLITPTQAKVEPNPRLKRAPTIIQNNVKPARTGMAPPPVSINSSRSNTMTSVSSATPRSADTAFLPSMPGSAVSLRSNNLRPPPVLPDGDADQIEEIWLKLDIATGLATPCLQKCQTDFVKRLEHANNTMQQTIAHTWTLAMIQCNTSISATTVMEQRVKAVKMKDPAVRANKEFWTMCDNFVHSWTDLVTTIKNIGDGKYDGVRHDVGNLKRVMRDVQRAVKEVSKIISISPLYTAAVRGRSVEPTPSWHMNGMAPPLPTSINIHSANAYATSTSNGYNTSVPATPLSAALGPAAHATITQGMDMGYGPPLDHYQPSRNASHTRIDTMMQPPTHSRR